MKDSFDVAVVGAGLAGLSAARQVAAAGLDVVVLEAAGRIGGRTRTEDIGGELVNFGAQWVGKRHRGMLRLVREFDLSLKPARLLGWPVRWRAPNGDRVSRVPHRRDLPAIVGTLRRLRRLSRRVDPLTPWAGQAAGELDRKSFGTWLTEGGVGGDAYSHLTGLVSMLSSTAADRLSLLQVVWWCARAGGPSVAAWTTFQHVIAEGSQAVCTCMAEQLGDRVITGAPVVAIDQGRDEVVLQVAGGTRYRARRVIATGASGVSGTVGFTPPLPPELAALRELSVEPGTKVTALLAPTTRVGHRGVLGGAPVQGAWRDGNHLVGFATPAVGDPTDAELLADLADGFGVAVGELRRPTVFRWRQHPSIPGCDIGFTPGQLTRLGPYLRAPHGLVRFAGAERSSWPNNMEGAVESGSRAAREVLASLGG